MIDPQPYGIVTFDESGAAISIDEKPETSASSYAIPGLYFYDSDVCDIVKGLRPSARDELEIADVNREYLKRGDLKVEFFSRGFAWFDTGTPDALLEASQFVSAIEKRQGLKIGCPEEIAFRMGMIEQSDLEDAAALYPNQYGNYLLAISMSDKK